MKIIRLYYRVQDCGDGSVSVRWYKEEKEAEDAEEHDIEEGGNGWGESSVNSIRLEIDDEGNLLNKTKREENPDWYDEDEKDFNELSI